MPATTRMIIANRLRDGLTVFLGAGGQWVVSIRRGAVSHTDAEAARLLAMAADAAARNVVVNPYLIAVRVLADGPVPVEWREAIRASGPTIGSGRAA